MVRQAKEGDYLSSVAQRAGIPVAALLLDNAGAIADLDAPLAGKALALCNRSAGGPTAAGGAAGGRDQDPLEQQLRALLDLKQAVDRTGLLKNWTAESGRAGGYCQWQHGMLPTDADESSKAAPYIMDVFCDKDKNVEQIGLRGANLGGTLPDASVLSRFPKLTQLVLGDIGLVGTLPDSWGVLTGLKVLSVVGGGGGGGAGGKISGSLPAAWGNLRQLEYFVLS